MLVFEDNIVLTEHYTIVHNQKRETKVVFGFSIRDDDKEEKKVINAVPQMTQQYRNDHPDLS